SSPLNPLTLLHLLLFASPLPFAEALESREVRELLPTELRTRLLQEIAPELRERAMFSAGVTNAEFLQKASDSIDELLAGRADRATLRLQLRQLLQRLQPEPASFDAEGGLTDLGSDRRLNLILDTNVEMAAGYGQWKQGQEDSILDLWPAQELVRTNSPRVPRDWPSRWLDAGGRVFGGRMIALKNDPIWTRLSRFGLPYPPFDFNSGMDVADIDRTEAIALGLIDRDTRVAAQDRDFNTDLQASPQVSSSSLRAALEETGLGRFDAQGVFRAA
ncbi:MAG: hypothetical protein ACREIA_09950, partial [Opitutaceae bacterium]